MRRRGLFRLIRPDTLAVEIEEPVRHESPHVFATVELVVSRISDGRVFRRLVPVPGGFKRVPLDGGAR